MKSKGFTLIEMLVVVAVIGLLISLAVVQLRTIRAKSRDTRRVVDILTISKALSLYYNNHQVYPLYPDGLVVDGADSLSQDLINDEAINQVPADPTSLDSGGPAECDYEFRSGLHYYYKSDTDGKTYILSYCLETNSQAGSKGYYEVGP